MSFWLNGFSFEARFSFEAGFSFEAEFFLLGFRLKVGFWWKGLSAEGDVLVE